ncbi:MAG: 2-C-methyl-D-erythritol 4-phosphate cytidylyltransferase [Clostridia bacterium]|nr:2-C-methyl-D-erythritol 4-phosphate cytidylyltransferase [Clostridia bacterium]
MKKDVNKRDYFVSCILAAGGKGNRMESSINKLFMEIDGVPVIARTLIALNKSSFIDEIIVSTLEENILDIKNIAEAFSINKLKSVIKGGSERAFSVKKAICEISDECDFVAVHDGARPLVDEETIKNAVLGAQKFGAAACGVRPKSTLKREGKDGFIRETVDRSEIFEIQTPQVFKKDLFEKAYDADSEVLNKATDDCSLIEQLGVKIKITDGSYSNIKITTKEDIAIAEGIIREFEI